MASYFGSFWSSAVKENLSTAAKPDSRKIFVVDMASMIGYTRVRNDQSYLEVSFENFFRAAFDISSDTTGVLKINLDDSNQRVRFYSTDYVNPNGTTLSKPKIVGSLGEYYEDLDVKLEINPMTRQVYSVSMLKYLPSTGGFSDQEVKFDLTVFSSKKPLPIDRTDRNIMIGSILEEISRMFLVEIFPEYSSKVFSGSRTHPLGDDKSDSKNLLMVRN